MAEEKENRYQMMENNANAVRAVMQAVENTIGPKGLDTMLVDQFGEVVITNDGITILDLMEANHPVAKMMIHAVKTQQQQVGDGTTTTALWAGEMILSGIEQIQKGVPTAQVMKGIRAGIVAADEAFCQEKISSTDQKDWRYHIALVAGREYADIAALIIQAAELVGEDKLKEENFRLADCVKAIENAQGEVLQGVLISKSRLNPQMPKEIDKEATILVLDDALQPEELGNDALATESGFQAYMALKKEFRENLQKIIEANIQVVLVDRGVDDEAEQTLADAGILVVSRVPHKELEAAAEHTGAKLLKRTGLKRSAAELKAACGKAQHVIENEKLEHIKLLGGAGKPAATIIISAATAEIVGERERIAKDAASSVQSAIREGVVAGGGAAELAVVRRLETMRNDLAGMSGFGMDCVINALKRPFMQVVKNAGFNPLEKIGDVNKAQQEKQNHHLAINCDDGAICDMVQFGIVDPLYVKRHGLKVAGEVAEAILRINMIIKKKEYKAD